MAEYIQMLALSPTMEDGTIVAWTKNENDSISSGDILCEVETDKATMEYESIQEGTLLKIIISEGDTAKVGDPIAIIGKKGEDFSDLLKNIGNDSQSNSKPEEKSASKSKKESSTLNKKTEIGIKLKTDNSRTKASPLARKMAEDAGINLNGISGSGPGGRIVKRDIEEAISKPKPTSSESSEEDTIIPLGRMRQVIANRLAGSKFSAPHFYLKVSVRGENLVESRKKINTTQIDKVSVNAFLIKFAAETLKRYPMVNSSWNEDSIIQFGKVNIGLAVALENGLITPVVKDAGNKGIIEIDKELKDLILKAKENKLTPEEYSGASFTISNLGSFGIEDFTAIINPPGSAILAVGSLDKKPVVNNQGEIEVGLEMKLTLSCDHRVIDGAEGAKFLNSLKETIENPIYALI